MNLGSQKEMKFTDPGGEDVVTYPASFSSAEIAAIMRLSPLLRMSNSYPVIQQIEMCIKGDPEYQACDSRDDHDKRFLKNAAVNIRHMQAALDDIKHTPRIDGLDEVVRYERSLQSFYLQVNRAKLDFYTSENATSLEVVIEGINSRVECKKELDRIKEAPSRRVALKLSQSDWYNCMNEKFREKIGNFPIKDWQDAMKRANIREKYVHVEE
jgi:hypothetical protein